jgi:hypothetical protein
VFEEDNHKETCVEEIRIACKFFMRNIQRTPFFVCGVESVLGLCLRKTIIREVREKLKEFVSF